MEFFRIRRTIPFMRYSKILNAISVVSFLVAVFFLFTHGLAFSIEFTGGTVMEVTYPNAAPTETIRQQIKNSLGVEAAVQTFGVEFVGPQVGEELASDGLTALLLVVFGIIVYLAFRFEWKFSVSAIIANMHDIILVLGFFSIFQWEFSLPVLAAILAVLGYSVNESVIIFDRVREHFKKMRRASTDEIINSAITATISRTVITHSSTLAMTLCMFFFGGPA